MKWLQAPKTRAVVPPAPLDWVQVSGDANKDARYVVCLPDLVARRREMGRLKHYYGQRYVDQVEHLVLQLWPYRQAHRGRIIMCRTMEEFDSLMTRLQAGHQPETVGNDR